MRGEDEGGQSTEGSKKLGPLTFPAVEAILSDSSSWTDGNVDVKGWQCRAWRGFYCPKG